MKKDELDARVTAAFQYSLSTLVEMLDLRHDDPKEFKSVKKAIVIGEHGTHRWVDPPEKKAYIDGLKATLREFVREGCEAAASGLFDPIITAYYRAARRKNPVKGKIKEPIQSE
jgi:hypothetical protein